MLKVWSAKHLLAIEGSRSVISFQFFFTASQYVYFPTIQGVAITDPDIFCSQKLDGNCLGELSIR